MRFLLENTEDINKKDSPEDLEKNRTYAWYKKLQTTMINQYMDSET